MFQSALKNLKSQLSPVLIWTNLTIGTLAAGIPITLQTTLARKVRNCLVILSQAFFCSSLEILIVSTPLSVFSAFWRPGKNWNNYTKSSTWLFLKLMQYTVHIIMISKIDRWIKGKTRWATILPKMVAYKVNVVYSTHYYDRRILLNDWNDRQ